MELKEKLRQILKERYGIENDAEIIKEAKEVEAIINESDGLHEEITSIISRYQGEILQENYSWRF